MARILIIEDDGALREALCEQLREAGHEAYGAKSGNEALKLADRQTVDLVITDIVMEDGEGFETIDRLRKLAPSLPIIAISGYPEYLRLIKKLGASRIIQKPFRMGEVLVLVDELLGPPPALGHKTGNITPISWKDYLTLPAADKAYQECRKWCAKGYKPLRRVIRNVVEALEPGKVACLGAGILNDIPYRALVRTAAKIHLVDWLPGAVDAGIARAILTENENRLPECVYCALEGEAPEAYCVHYQKTGDNGNTVCDHFEAGNGDFLTCAAFERGERPFVRREDITGGLATAFGEKVGEALGNVKSWKQALHRAQALANRVRHHHDSLGIEDDSIDLVTSSMVMSQFEHKPYDYFSKRALDILGPPGKKEEKRLVGELDSLRSKLLIWQAERHCDEIERILAPGGRCFMAFELFHYDPESKRWFPVKEMHDVLDILGRRFDFDFGTLPAAESCLELQVRSAPSMVQTFILRQKAP